MEKDEEIFGPKFFDLFEKLNLLITEKEKYENSKKNILSEIENAKHKIKVLKSAPVIKPTIPPSELDKKEKELYTCLKRYKEESEELETLKKANFELEDKKQKLENEISLIIKNIEELIKSQTATEKDINGLESQLMNTQREIEINGLKYKESLERFKTISQMRNLKKIEIENLLQKFDDIKKAKKVNKVLLKSQENALDNIYKSLQARIDETSNLLTTFLNISNNNEKLQIISKKYMDKVNENNKIREENERLKERINTASIKNFQNKLQNFSPAKKQRSISKEAENEKYETIKGNMEKIKRLIIDINIIQNKK